jgi:FkbM family methyltransferase
MEIKYGLANNNIDVTHICYSKLLKDNIIIIPLGDSNRASHFCDPLVGIPKSIFITNNNVRTEYNQDYKIKINTTDNTVQPKRLCDIHNSLQLRHGSFNDELPEQRMAFHYIQGNEKVLEIGSNIGRNTLVIASLLDSNNFVTLESDKDIANQLLENKQLNNMNFHIETSALSKRSLIQKGWDTIESDVVLPGYKKVDTITWEQLNNKYNIPFDTLVLDCEGAFYYILMDMPEILTNINLIIMENDYYDLSKKNEVDKILKQNNFYVDYTQSGGWGPCANYFFQVWKR